MSENDHLAQVRKAFLAALNASHNNIALLRDMLSEAEQQHPLLFVDEENSGMPFAGDSLNWNDRYFAMHRKLAESNFTRQRIDHLIKVRDYFQQQGHKGFRPRVQQGQETSSMNESSYEPPSNLKKFADTGDIASTRTALRIELDNRRLDGDALRAAAAWTKSRFPAIFELYAEKAFASGTNDDISQWTEDYYDEQIVGLKANFAKERFLHLVDVREHLRPYIASTRQPEASRPVAASPSSGSDRRSPQPAGDREEGLAPSSMSPALRTALMVGGAIAALAILLLSIVR